MAPVADKLTYQSEFSLLSSCSLNGKISVKKYTSPRTGLKIVLSDVDGPIVNGYFVLATEVLDDDGIPHTLEHLIFLGSEDYPYKGILDIAANRCLASGTNAWTDTDHTAYTVTTAGCDGFLNILPMYLDHVLYPTLTDSGFITEVHHITGEGKDAGVVYCEMQGRETTGESLAELELLRSLYPGKCGYKSETGGIVKNLRESTNIVDIRKFHNTFYRPENLTIIVTGHVEEEDIFRVIRGFESKILSKGDRGPFTRPWQSPVAPLLSPVTKDVRYPSDQEDNGMVYFAWQGPISCVEYYKLTAMNVLLRYLTHTAASPLMKTFVEIADPYCCDVDHMVITNSTTALLLQFEGVPIGKIPLIQGELTRVLKEIANSNANEGEGYEGISMTRMKHLLKMLQSSTIYKLEKSPHDYIAKMVIVDFLYGTENEAMGDYLNEIGTLDKLSKEPPSFWISLLKDYLVERPCVQVRAHPSIEEYNQRSAEEKKRLLDQCQKLGKDGLERKAQELKKAIEENEREGPSSLITSVDIPDPEKSIKYHDLECFSPDTSTQHVDFSTLVAPIYTRLDDLNSNFIYVNISMDSSRLDLKFRNYLPLLVEYLLECPIERDGVFIPHEDVVKELEADNITVNAGIGVNSQERFSCGQFSDCVNLCLIFEPENYVKGISWTRDLLHNSRFTAERLCVVAKKLINSVSQVRRNGSIIVKDVMRAMLFKLDTNLVVNTALYQQNFLNDVLEKLSNEETANVVIKILESLRKLLTSPQNLVAQLSTDVGRLSRTYELPDRVWASILSSKVEPVRKCVKIPSDSEALMNWNEHVYKSCVVGMATVDSAFLLQSAKCVADINDPDYAPLLVLTQYLTQLEGVMWKQIRGFGLAYSYSMAPKINEGLVNLSFFRATNVVEAFNKTRNIVNEYLSKKDAWDVTYFDSARSSLIYTLVQQEKTLSDVVKLSMMTYLQRVRKDYNRELIRRVWKVKMDDLTRVGLKYLSPLFDPATSRTSIICHSSKVEEVAASFKKMGYKLDVYRTLEDCFINPNHPKCEATVE